MQTGKRIPLINGCEGCNQSVLSDPHQEETLLAHNFGILVVMFCSPKCLEFKADSLTIDSRCLASFKLHTPGLNIYIFLFFSFS